MARKQFWGCKCYKNKYLFKTTKRHQNLTEKMGKENWQTHTGIKGHNSNCMTPSISHKTHWMGCHIYVWYKTRTYKNITLFYLTTATTTIYFLLFYSRLPSLYKEQNGSLMTCNLQVILNDNELIPTKKAITVDEPVSLGPLRSETQSHSSSLRPPFSSNLTTCSFHKRKSLLHFVL